MNQCGKTRLDNVVMTFVEQVKIHLILLYENCKLHVNSPINTFL